MTLSFASALLQSLVAIAVVGIMGVAMHSIEIASYLLVIAVGLRLACLMGCAFFAELRRYRAPAAAPIG